MTPLLHTCLTAPTAVPETATVAAWCARWRDRPPLATRPFDLALQGGFGADRLAWAFASGYQAALRALLPTLPPQAVVGFCVTEAAGNRPRDLRTTARAQADGHWVIDGDKRWATLGGACDHYLVVCVMGGDATAPAGAGTAPMLRALRVPADAPGLAVAAMPVTAFVPELPHAELHLRGVRVAADALLPGDGWSDYGKPFRTLEDLHITAAVLAYLLREARAQAWPADLAQRLAAALHALHGLAAQPVDAAATHVALAGARDWAQGLFTEAGALFAARPADAAAQRWQRDVPLLQVAGGARQARVARAWQRLAGEAPAA